MGLNYRVMINAVDRTTLWQAERRVISIDVEDQEGEASDSCTLVLDDRAPHIQWPPEGATLRLWLADDGDPLVDMGMYSLDAPEASGPPDMLTVRGHAAHFVATGARLPMQTQRSRVWDTITLANMAQTIAADHGLIARVQAEVAAELVDPCEQWEQSDAEFFRDVCKRYGARMRVKAATGTLGGALEVVGAGSQLPQVVLGRGDLESWSAPFGSRIKVGTVVANWHNPKSGGSGTTKAGNAEPVLVLAEVFETASSASSAAKSRLKDKERDSAQLSLTLTKLDTTIASGTEIALSGIRSEIDTVWNVVSARHRAEASRPRTTLTCERAA